MQPTGARPATTPAAEDVASLDVEGEEFADQSADNDRANAESRRTTRRAVGGSAGGLRGRAAYARQPAQPIAAGRGDYAGATATNRPGGASFEGPSRPRSIASLAAVAVQGGVTRYDLPMRVTVPDRSATMVLLASRDVPGERLYLFAPDPGVGDSTRHPFNVARFVNRTGSMLERGPLAIFESGAFLGQGMIDPLPNDATAVVPFALERGLAVESASTYDVEGARLVSIRRGLVQLERFRTTRSTYRVRNGMDREVRVLVRVPTPEGTSLFEPPPMTETANGAALVPVRVAPRGRGEQLVVVRARSR